MSSSLADDCDSILGSAILLGLVARLGRWPRSLKESNFEFELDLLDFGEVSRLENS